MKPIILLLGTTTSSLSDASWLVGGRVLKAARFQSDVLDLGETIGYENLLGSE